MNEILDRIRTIVENLIDLCGVTGTMVPVLRHVLLAAVAVGLSWASFWLSKRLLIPLVGRITARTSVRWDGVLLNRKVLLAACRIVPAVVIYALLPLVFYQEPWLRELLARITALYITYESMCLVVVLIDSFRDLETHHGSSVQQYIQSFCGVLKIVAIFIGVVVMISLIIDKSPLKLFAGLGATSAILMLVFKDTIEGLVAGIRLTSNDMLHRGDWITVAAANADGEVQEMSLTTVKIQNFDNTIVTVSPKTLVDGSFQNWKGMQQSAGRRVSRRVYFDFRSILPTSSELKSACLEKGYLTEAELKSDSTNLGLYRRFVEKRLPAFSYVNADMTYMVRLLEATNAGLPVEFYFFLKEKEWKTYEHQLAEIMEWCYITAPFFGLRIYERSSTDTNKGA